MQAFKLYFKVFKKGALISSIIYVVIFSAICILFSQLGTNDTSKAFSIEKCRIAVINNDNSKFSDELVKYIDKNSEVVKIDTSERGIKDALFYRKAEYIITIPNGYGDAFVAGKPIELETRTIPDSMSGAFVDMSIDRYLNVFNFYLKGTDNLPFDEIVSHVNTDLSVKTTVDLSGNAKISEFDVTSAFFNYASYPIFCILILSVGIVLNTVNQKEIKRRNLCAPINSTKFSLTIFLGNIVVMCAIFALFVIYAILLLPNLFATISGVFYVVNLFIISLVALSMSFLIGNFAGKKAINPICNTVSLAYAFLGGAFVPQSMLSDSVKNYSIINPVFWFVKANDQISAISNFNSETVKPIIQNYLYQLIYAAVFLIAALVLIRKARTKN